MNKINKKKHSLAINTFFDKLNKLFFILCAVTSKIFALQFLKVIQLKIQKKKAWRECYNNSPNVLNVL